MPNVSPPDPNASGPAYQSRYDVSPEFKQFWHQMFKGTAITDKEMHQMTDQFIKMVSDQCRQVLNWAIAQQKERDRKAKEERGG